MLYFILFYILFYGMIILNLKECGMQEWWCHGHFSIPYNGVWKAAPLSPRRNGDGMATSPSHLHLKEVDGQSNISKDAWRWHGHFSIPYKGVWMATPLSLRRNGDGMASTPFHSIHTPFNGMERWPCHHHSSLEIMEWQSTPLYMEWRSGHAIARLP